VRYQFLALAQPTLPLPFKVGTPSNSSDEAERRSMHASTLRRSVSWKAGVLGQGC
jgi:hypothetical protein